MSVRHEPHQREDYDGYVDRIARGVGMSSAGQGIGRLIGYATAAAIAKLHGKAQLGFYALGIVVLQVANILSQFGMDNGVVRYVARYRTEGDTARVRGVIIQALCVTFGLSVILSAGIFFGAGTLADRVFDKPFLETMFQIFAVALPFFTLMSITLWATQGFQTVRYATLVREILRPLMNLIFVFVFYFLGVEILGAVVAYIISMIFGSIMALYYLTKIFPSLLDRAIDPVYESRALFSVSGPMIIANFTQYINLWTALVVLGVFVSAGEVGIYDVAARTATLSALVLISFAGIFSPMISSLHQRSLMGDLSYLYKDVSRWTFTGALVFFLITTLLAQDIMAFFRRRLRSRLAGNSHYRGGPALQLFCRPDGPHPGDDRTAADGYGRHDKLGFHRNRLEPFAGPVLWHLWGGCGHGGGPGRFQLAEPVFRPPVSRVLALRVALCEASGRRHCLLRGSLSGTARFAWLRRAARADSFYAAVRRDFRGNAHCSWPQSQRPKIPFLLLDGGSA